MSDLPSVFDIYVIRTSGVPLVSGCTGTEFCMTHSGQHELQSGFLAALNSFSQIAFDNESIRVLEMVNLQLNFKVNTDKDLIFATVNPITADREDIRAKITKGMDKFIDQFGDRLEKKISPQVMFDEFKPILIEIGLIENKFASTIDAQNVDNSKKLRILKWIRSLRN